MNITFVLAVYNKLELTKQFYEHLRSIYPKAPLVISSGGSNDGTKEWLESLNDKKLLFTHTDERITFSENYNRGIKMVETNKLVLIHNDMVIGKQFLENLEVLLTEDMLLSYTTIEPPVFVDHLRPGKVLLDLGSSFDDFSFRLFNRYVDINKDNKNLYDGAVFFMSGYKSMFEDVGYFDGFSFTPAFCEDDDFLIRAKLKGYKLKTTDSAITYHFVSQTSRFSPDFINERQKNEINSNRNFIRKWGTPISSFNWVDYQNQDNFEYRRFSVGLKTNIEDINIIKIIEPFFSKIQCNADYASYVNDEQSNTNYNLKEKFLDINDCDVIIECNNLQQEDYNIITTLQFILSKITSGKYEIGNLKITLK